MTSKVNTFENQTNDMAKENTRISKVISIQFFKSNRKNSKVLKYKFIDRDINDVIDLYDILDSYNKLQKTYRKMAISITLYEDYNAGLCNRCRINATLCNKKVFSSYEEFINQIRSAIVLRQGLEAWYLLAGIHYNEIVRSLIHTHYHN